MRSSSARWQIILSSLIVSLVLVEFAWASEGVVNKNPFVNPTKNKPVELCQRDSNSAYTIMVSEKTVASYLARGASLGKCAFDKNTQCDDKNACTIDTNQNGECIPAKERQAVNCDDNNTCTLDSCNPNIGCVNSPTRVTESCDEDNLCIENAKCQPDGTCAGEELCALPPDHPWRGCIESSCGIYGECHFSIYINGSTCTRDGMLGTCSNGRCQIDE